MDEETFNSRLSRISTIWTTLEEAHRGAGSEAEVARLEFIQRYQGAAYRYLLGAVKDPDVADELFQEFALRFMQGAFRHADRKLGRFRAYLKTALYRSVTGYFHKKQQLPLQLDSSLVQPTAHPWAAEDSERQFTQSWREELLARTWDALSKVEQRTGPSPYEILKLRSENPQATSDELARRMTEQSTTDRPMSPGSVRKAVERARNRFAELLIREVRRSLDEPSREELEQELIDLELMSYCRTTFQRQKGH